MVRQIWRNMKTKDLILYFPPFFYDSRLRASLHRPKVLQWALGTSTCFRFWKKIKNKKSGRGERACPLQVHRKSPDLQDGFAEMVWVHVLVKTVSTIQSNEVKLHKETGFIWFRGYSFNTFFLGRSWILERIVCLGTVRKAKWHRYKNWFTFF